MRTSVENVELYTQSWRRNGVEPECIVFFSHGLHGSTDDFAKFPDYLCEQLNAICFSHDHYGHGRSKGNRVCPPNFEVYVEDVVSHAKDIKIEFPDIPIFLIGESMGGLIAYHVAYTYPSLFTAIILLAPALEVSQTVVSLMWMKPLLQRLVWLFPNLPIPHNINSKELTTDLEEQIVVENAPNTYRGGVKLRNANLIHIAIEKAQKNFKSYSSPTLILFGEEDNICSLSGARKFMEESSSADKQLITFPGLKHLLLREIPEMRSKVFETINDWIKARLH